MIFKTRARAVARPKNRTQANHGNGMARQHPTQPIADSIETADSRTFPNNNLQPHTLNTYT